MVPVNYRSKKEELNFIRDKQIPVFFWTVSNTPVDLTKLASDILEHLSNQVYISIDLDVLALHSVFSRLRRLLSFEFTQDSGQGWPGRQFRIWLP